MPNLKSASLILSATLLSGCFFIGDTPKGKSFDSEIDLKRLEGCYDNRNSESARPYPRELASYIFSFKDIGDNKVDFIRVVAEGENALRVSAESLSDVIVQKTFVAGRDFHFESGRVRIDVDMDEPDGPGDVFLGVRRVSRYLGLDQYGDGLSEESGVMAGTIFLVIPLAAVGNEGFSYKRRPDLCAAAKSN